MSRRPWKPRAIKLAQFGLICGRNPRTCEHPHPIRRGKLLYCLDCSRFLPFMPLWLMIQSEEYDRRHRPPRKIAPAKKGKRPKLTREEVDRIMANIPLLTRRRKRAK